MNFHFQSHLSSIIIIIIIITIIIEHCLAIGEYPKKRTTLRTTTYNNSDFFEQMEKHRKINNGNDSIDHDGPSTRSPTPSISTEKSSFEEGSFLQILDSFYRWLDKYHHDEPKRYWLTMFTLEIVWIIIGYMAGRQFH